MKKKIIIGAFSTLILITVIIFLVGAIVSYNHDITNHSDDKWIGFGAALSLMVGGFIVFYELDLFYTVYYFFLKPKTKMKSILNILSNISLLLIFFTDSIAHFLWEYVSELFGEEVIVLFAFVFLYVILRVVYALVSDIQSTKEK